MEKTVVLGIGNQLMMDDGIGIYLVQELLERDDIPGIHYVIGESDIDYCLEQVEGAGFVIILDAVASGKEPGELSVYRLCELNEVQPLDISPHNLHLFQVLYQQKDSVEGYLVGVEPYEVSFHIGLSSVLAEKWDRMLHEVKEAVEMLSSGERSREV